MDIHLSQSIDEASLCGKFAKLRVTLDPEICNLWAIFGARPVTKRLLEKSTATAA